MNRRLFSKWAFWLLPWLVARAFLPVGFMLAANAGGLELVFCPDTAPLARSLGTVADAAEVPHAHGGAHPKHHQSGQQIDPPCPFALATPAAAIDVPHQAAAVLRVADEAFPEITTIVARPRPGRAQSIRGPPSLS